MAIAINEEIDYVLIGYGEEKEKYILAKERLAVLKEGYKILQEFSGGKLIGSEYEPLYDITAVKNSGKKSRYVVSADFVTTEDGTGIVHIAPMHGEDDYNVGVRYDLPVIPLLDSNGHFNKDAPEFIQGFYLKKGRNMLRKIWKKRIDFCQTGAYSFLPALPPMRDTALL